MHTGSLKFIELQSSDLDQIWQLLQEVYAAPEFPIGGAWNRAQIERELDQGRGFGYLSGSVLEAFVLIRRLPEAWEILVLGTRLNQRRKGLMKGLLTELEQRKPRDLALWLEVHSGNLSALNLYKKLGFRQVGQRPNYYRDGAAAILFSLG